MGVVYHSNYFVWFEVGRTDLLRQFGMTYRELEAQGLGLPVIEAHCDFRQPARYDDELEVATTGGVLSPARLRFDYTIRRTTDNLLLATGYTVHAAVDPSGRPRRVPPDVTAWLTSSTEASS
jgi:acyl-CoA thioester hydrolase